MYVDPNGPAQSLFDLALLIGAASAIFMFVIRPIWRALTGTSSGKQDE